MTFRRTIFLGALAIAAGTTQAQAQQLCRFDWNAGTMVLSANKTGQWTGGPNARQMAGQRGATTWRVDGDVIHIDWQIVSEGHMKGRTGFTRPPLSQCPSASRVR